MAPAQNFFSKADRASPKYEKHEMTKYACKIKRQVAGDHLKQAMLITFYSAMIIIINILGRNHIFHIKFFLTLL